MANVSHSPLAAYLEKARPLFYLVGPQESSFELADQVPDYTEQVTPMFLTLIVLEIVVQWLQGETLTRFNDGLTSASAGMFMRLVQICILDIEVTIYGWVYNNYRLWSLPWDSAWTWWLAFFTVDMGYYWFHRMAHEVNIFWAAHQVHHSSEDYNLSTALRQAALQQYTSWIFYLPLALAIPSPIFVAHHQFNTLYQFWIHTKVIKKLGPLEWVLNTPSHHRVHHGRNRYCIDKNYAGTLIIWDRMFGTFQAEEDTVVYGLTHPINTFDLFKVQFCHLEYMWSVFWDTRGIVNKLKVIFYGPGWAPSKPRLGMIEDIPDVHHPVEAYNPRISPWVTAHLVLHFFVTLICFQEFYLRQSGLSPLSVIFFAAYITLSLTAIGAVLDKKSYGNHLQLLCNVIFLFGAHHSGPQSFIDSASSAVLQAYAAVSSVIWAVGSFTSTSSAFSNKKSQ